jgi:hypothetical protein
VSRYPASERDQRENRATEILAGVCSEVDGLAQCLALRWLEPQADSAAWPEQPGRDTASAHAALRALPRCTPVRVRTQVATVGRFVDLEFRFLDDETPARTVVLVWVEVKHGTRPHSEQIPAYADSRPSYPGAVVLLAPRDDLPADPTQCPPSVPQRSWPATARSIQRFSPTDPVARWLVHELLRYLQEENLMDPVALGPEHLTALAYGRPAQDALALVCETAARYIAQHWAETDNEEESRGKPAYGVGYGQAWGAPTDGQSEDAWDGAWFDWKVAESRGDPAPDGAVFFMAGLSKHRGREFADATGAWQQTLETGLCHGSSVLRFERWLGRVERLQRIASPQDVLHGRTLEEQGESIGRWVVETFRALEKHGPPGGAT